MKNPIELHIELMQSICMLLALDTDINEPDEYGDTVLFETATPDLAELSLQYGGNLHHQNIIGNTPLFFVDHPEVAKIYMKHGADPNHKNFFGENALFHTQDVNMTELFISEGCDVLHKNKDGRTPLFYTCNHEIIDVLLKNKLTFVDHDIYNMIPYNLISPDMRQRLAYYFTTDRSNYEWVCDVILNDRKKIELKLKNKMPPCYLVDPFIKRIFSDNFNYDHPDMIFIQAGEFESPEELEHYLKQGVNPNVTDSDDNSLLFNIKNSVCAKLLIDAGTDVDKKDRMYSTALTHVKNVDVAKLLIQAGADVNHVNGFDRTPLEYATCPLIQTLLLDAGAIQRTPKIYPITPLMKLYRQVRSNFYKNETQILNYINDTL